MGRTFFFFGGGGIILACQCLFAYILRIVYVDNKVATHENNIEIFKIWLQVGYAQSLALQFLNVQPVFITAQLPVLF